MGTTGSAGRMAVQIAKRFGAARVIAAGRDATRLAALTDLGADEVVAFDQAERAADVDVVIDYVWGEPSGRAMTAMATARRDRGAPLDWVRVGSVAGQTAPVHASLLRAVRLQLCGSGSGIGSVPARDFLAELPEPPPPCTRAGSRCGHVRCPWPGSPRPGTSRPTTASSTSRDGRDLIRPPGRAGRRRRRPAPGRAGRAW
ncbi:zinc-binding dehydrogenase [Saccharothrix sp. S26]|uniref:zinc-binding dehydrogenase n=1 Tax=Saccharothrix sp. S26 TaxID=2907215 RepID=UPI001F2C8561|nr:zinc-binding dehydrogenase [Saccharothrix sp. S26]MCE6999040.1 zinc-binding dehydrogenase [Saccharothrix sp. S26]